MKSSNLSKKLILPKNQLNLFNYDDHCKSFIKLYQINKLPNCILLNGVEGSGKATFAYHLINFILSIDEENKYSIDNFKINENNSSYKLVNNGIHPNLFVIDQSESEIVKIDKSRELIKFVNKSTYSKNVKLILIDSIENLNINATNALLKCIEEPDEKTYFLIIHNSSSRILSTIKSRCIEYRVHFNSQQKEIILKNLSMQYDIKFNYKKFNSEFYYESPGNIIKYFINNDLELSNPISLNIIFDFIEKISYSKKKSSDQIIFLSTLIEKYYLMLCTNYSFNSSKYYFNFLYIAKLIDRMKRYNLYDKNVFIQIKNLLQHG